MRECLLCPDILFGGESQHALQHAELRQPLLPIRYLDIGRMSGTMGTVGATLSIGDRALDDGRWWIEANYLCQQWASWLNSRTYCYKLTRRGHTVQWLRNDGHLGTARIGD